MFGERFRSESNKTQEADERLSGLLHEWRAFEPKANFESAVWRRIRAASVADQAGLSLSGIFRNWLMARPAWASAVAASVAILLGAGAGLSSLPGAGSAGQAVEPLLHSQTLAGAYLAMVTGGTR